MIVISAKGIHLGSFFISKAVPQACGILTVDNLNTVNFIYDRFILNN